MRAMVFDGAGPELVLSELDVPQPGTGEVQIQVEACGVCRTDLHVIDGELDRPALPLVPGHEIVGRVSCLGKDISGVRLGQRVGVPWMGKTCGSCPYCKSGSENLCDHPGFTGYNINGGYAEYCVADENYVFALPEEGEAADLAPLLCAGLIGYRALKQCGDVSTLGIYGFGAAAHILCQIARFKGIKVFAFTRKNDRSTQEFAMSLGATWAGASGEPAPEALDAAIIFAPAGELVPIALRAVRKGGRVVCGGIHMSDIPGFAYSDLWEERTLVSVANLTRLDGEEFFPLAAKAKVSTHIKTYPLEEANQALNDLRNGQLQGAAVLVVPRQRQNGGLD